MEVLLTWCYLLSIISFLLAIIFDFSIAIYLGNIFLMIISIFLLIKNILNIKFRFSFIEIQVIFILVFTSTGTLLNISRNRELYEVNYLTNSSIATAHLFVTLFCGTLLFFSNSNLVKKILFGDSNNLIDMNVDSKIITSFSHFHKNNKFTYQYTWIIAFYAAVQLALIMSGYVHYFGYGFAQLETASIPFLLVIFNAFRVQQELISGFLLSISSTFYNKSFITKIVSLASILISITWSFSLGNRRIFLFTLLLILFGYILGKINQLEKYKNLSSNFYNKRGKSLIKKIIIFLVLFLIFYFGFALLSISRYKSDKGYNFTSKNPLQNIVENYEYLNDPDSKFTQESMLEKSTERANFIRSLAKPIEINSERNQKYLLGQDLWNSFLVATPSDFLVSKRKVLTNENLYYQIYRDGYFLNDTADSLYRSAYFDFGFYGSFLYPIIIYISISLLLMICSKSQSTFLHFSCISSILFFAFSSIESSTISFFIVFRHLAFIYLIIKFLSFFGINYNHVTKNKIL